MFPKPFPARPCSVCGGTVLVGMESFHLCPGPRIASGRIGSIRA